MFGEFLVKREDQQLLNIQSLMAKTEDCRQADIPLISAFSAHFHSDRIILNILYKKVVSYNILLTEILGCSQ